jgi:hypothetical protein
MRIDGTVLPLTWPFRPGETRLAFDGDPAMTERRLGLGDKLASVFPDRSDPQRVVHSLVDMFRARLSATAAATRADDLDRLRSDSAFKLACGRLPDGSRSRSVLPTNTVAPGECSAPARRHPRKWPASEPVAAPIVDRQLSTVRSSAACTAGPGSGAPRATRTQSSMGAID